MGIGVLGTLTVDEAPAPLGRRDRVVLSALATRPGHVVSRDALADALWREDPPTSAPKVVQGCVLRLRKLLGPDAIETAPPGYLLAEGKIEIDARRFEDAVGKARDLLALGQSDRAAHAVDDALALWRGRPLPDVEDWEPGVLEARRLEDLRRDAEELRVDCYLRSGRHHEVIADAAALLREAPTREARWALLARAQYQDGRQTEALATLRQASDLLADRVGIDPGPELGRLRDAMLRQDPELLPAPPGAGGSSHCPYRGLAAYEVTDADSFFGRDTDVAAGLLLLERQGVLALVGPSGGGKSSVVRAGVAATLVRKGRRVRLMAPGEAPVAALEALPRLQRGDVLVVDQCEEVFSLCQDEQQRVEFLERLVRHADECGPLVVAMRADRLADVTPHPAFARLVERGLYLLGALDERGLRDVIETPARDTGLLLEPGLVDLLVTEVLHEPGALPLLSHALQETWARREGHTLTVAAYRASGGIRGAVAQTAEQVYERVDPAQRHLIRELMLRLVSMGQAGEPSRIRAPRERVIAEPSQERLVDDLVAARLLTSEQGSIEITHESLARAWPRLREWLADDVEGQRILHHLSTAAEAWESLGRPDSELYRGARLTQALEWSSRSRVELTPWEREFLEAARRAVEQEHRAVVDQARRQARLIRGQRIALVTGSVFLVMALAAGAVALGQGNRAREGERSAERSELVAEAGRIGARALTVEDPSVALLLAVEAVHLDDNAQTRSYLRAAMARRPELVASTEEPSTFLMGLSVNAERNDVVSVSFDNVVHRYDLDTGEEEAAFDVDGAGVTRSNLYPPGQVAGDEQGRVVAVGSNNFSRPGLWLLDRESLEPLPDQPPGLPRRGGKAVGLDISANGRWLAASFTVAPAGVQPEDVFTPRNLARVWDLTKPDQPPFRVSLPSSDDGWIRIRISDDGRTLYGGGPPKAYRVRGKGTRWERPDLVSTGGSPIDLTRDGRLLAVPTDDAGAYLLDTATGRTVRHVGESEELWGVAVAPDGSRVAATDARQLFVWDVGTGELVHRSDQGIAASLDLSAHRDLVHLTGAHGVETWDVTRARSFVSRQPIEVHQASALEVSPGGELVAEVVNRGGPFSDSPSDLILISTATGQEVLRRKVGVVNGTGSWMPSGEAYLLGTSSGRVVTVSTTGTVDTYRGTLAPTVRVTASRDGRYLILLDEKGFIRRLRTDGRPAGPAFRVGTGTATDVAVTDDGTRALVLMAAPRLGPSEMSPERAWVMVDPDDGSTVSQGELPSSGDEFGWEGVAFRPGVRDRIALFGEGGVQVLDLETGRPLVERVAAHDGNVKGTYSPDGSTIVTGGLVSEIEGDGRIVLWDGKSGRVLDAAVLEPGSGIHAVLTKDGTQVVAATDHAVYRWDTRIDKAVEAACRAAGRSMSEVEWRTNVGDVIPYHATCG